MEYTLETCPIFWDHLKDQIDALKTEVGKIARQANRGWPGGANANNAVTSRHEKVKLSISGHVNRALMLADDGDQSGLFRVDNDTEPTLVNFMGTVAVDNGLTVGAQVEAQLASNPSNAVSQDTENSSTGSTSFTERHLEVFVDSKRYGKISLGQGNTASEGASEIDLSGTNIVTRSNFGTLGGGLLFRNSGTNALSTVSVGNAFDSFDGLSRNDRIRYDTPGFGGIRLSASAVQGGATDFALRYAADYGGTKVAAGAAVANRSSTSSTVERQWNGSGSVLLQNGVNLTVAALRCLADVRPFAGRHRPVLRDHRPRVSAGPPGGPARWPRHHGDGRRHGGRRLAVGLDL